MIITTIPYEGYIHTGLTYPACEKWLYVPGDVEPDIDAIAGETCRECEWEAEHLAAQAAEKAYDRMAEQEFDWVIEIECLSHITCDECLAHETCPEYQSQVRQQQLMLMDEQIHRLDDDFVRILQGRLAPDGFLW